MGIDIGFSLCGKQNEFFKKALVCLEIHKIKKQGC